MAWGNKRGAVNGTWVKPSELSDGTHFDVTFAKWFENDKGRAVVCVNNDNGEELLFGSKAIRTIFEGLLIGARIRLTYEETIKTKSGDDFHVWSYEPWIDEDEDDAPLPKPSKKQEQSIDDLFKDKDEIPF